MYEERKANLVARARTIKARLDDIQSRAERDHRDLLPSEQREVNQYRDEARKLQKKAKDIAFDEEQEAIMDNMARGIHPSGKSGSPKTGGALFGFKESDLRTMHDAARRHVPMKLVSRTESPMSDRTEYLLPQFDFLRDSFRLLDHLPTLQTESGRIAYFSAISGATGAAPVAEGDPKPESSPLWQEAEAVVQKVAHYAKATTEAIADFSDFMRVVSDELLRGLVTHRDRTVAERQRHTAEFAGSAQHEWYFGTSESSRFQSRCTA